MTCFPFLFRRGKASPVKRVVEIDEDNSVVENLESYSCKVLRAATKDFSPDYKIGEGGFGSVYKGRLKGGKIVAVKVLSAESRQGVKEFMTEIKVISAVEHENLVKLYGCCVEGNNRILVYEYLENNSLAHTLVDRGHNSLHFCWKTRSKIATGVASGLAYLHGRHVLHRDIKASNILLDKDLIPKISDFGLAKLLPPNETHLSTRVAGTIGYLAPEYAVRGQVTKKSDIYSFGVLLLEIVSGRCNNDTRLPSKDQFLLERNALLPHDFDMPGILLLQTWELFERRELVIIVDQALDGDYDVEEACRFLKVALLCTQDAPKLRPSMTSVVNMLKGEQTIDEAKITKPGLISDFMDLKVRPPRERPNISNSTFTTSGMDSSSTSTLANNTTYGFMTFQAASGSDRV